MRLLSCLCLFPVVTLVLIGMARAAAGQAREVRFDRDIQPILSSRCYSCHGPDEAGREAGLRLDTKAGVFADLGGHRVITPSAASDSELFLRIASSDPDERMPPVDSEYMQSREEIALIQRWIEQGAQWQTHWAFVTPSRPALPKVQDEAWVRTPIDRFVLAQLERLGWQPSPVADRRTLMRRVSFDLTGLPPRFEDVDAFVADQSAGAYERVVDRLLSSPHYGEQMARHWLDVARYGDTHGLHVDNYREMWPYRDWVINAFNANMPYDQFVTEQLAGDLLPAATLEQQVATGFTRCHVTTNEGGSIAEEVFVRNVVDRVSTMGTALLGLTLGCAVCHDHKFDPISQQDFYQLFAFFNNLDGPEMDGNSKHPAPVCRVPTRAQTERLDAIRHKMAALEEQRAHLGTRSVGKHRLTLPLARSASQLAAAKFDVREGLVLHYPMDEGRGNALTSLAGNSKKSAPTGSITGSVHWVPGTVGSGLEFRGDGYVDLGDVGDFDEDEGFSYGAWVRMPTPVSGTVMAKTNVKDLEKGYELSVVDGRVVTQLNGRWPGYAIKISTREEVIRANDWRHLLVTYDGSKLAQGVTIYVDGQPQPADIVCDSLHTEGSIQHGKPLLLGRRDTEAPLSGGSLDDVRLYDRELLDAEVRSVYLLPRATRLLAISPSDRTDEQRFALRKLAIVRGDPEYLQLTRDLKGLRDQYDREWLQVATTPVFRERRRPRDAYVLTRGQYDQRGMRVAAHTPASLPPMDDHLPRNRLGLARWLVARDQPLTSRVAVNRIWQQLFGTGIVATPEDFGIQGSLPSHPELLDWLAVEFQEQGWNVKALVKQIVVSATYRQSSRSTPELNRRDPKNHQLARGPRFRLDAEMLRDQALAVSGLWHDRVGGPSVKPPQPDGLWRAVGLSDSDTARFEQDQGPDKLYRRSLYTFWKAHGTAATNGDLRRTQS